MEDKQFSYGLVSGSGTLQLALLLRSCFCLQFGSEVDSSTITSSKAIKDPEAIISDGGVFRLGFFSLANSTDRYVGIWYNRIPVQTAIWVANKNKPLRDSSGILTISEDGNLVLLNGKKQILWSSNVTNPISNASAQLFDSGNLVLLRSTSRTIMWESFKHPSNALVQNAKLRTDIRPGEKLQKTSWKSPSDPSDGNFSAGIDPLNIPEAFIWNNNRPYWRSGPWNGNLALRAWDDEKGDWVAVWSLPKTECNIYGQCGAFGSCDSLKPSICSCLRGFEPKIIEEWNRGNWTSGCVRSKPLQCERVNNRSELGKAD